MFSLNGCDYGFDILALFHNDLAATLLLNLQEHIQVVNHAALTKESKLDF